LGLDAPVRSVSDSGMRAIRALALAFIVLATAGPAQALKVSENGRFLVKDDGSPFFWLGDTAWRLQRLTPDDLAYYLDTRKAQGYTVIQGPILTHDSHTVPGERNTDPFNPNEAFFAGIDRIVAETARRGLYSALVVTWGHNFAAFRDPDGARSYGRWLASRYRDRVNIVWIVAGEYAIDGWGDFANSIWRGLGDGLREGSAGRHLITVHGSWTPPALQTSSTFFHVEPWLSFNMIQSGQGGNTRPGAASWELVEADYRKRPAKPVLDGEATYEGEQSKDRPTWDGFGVRRRAYWSVFAGGFGHTYGADRVFYFEEGWRERLFREGGATMTHLRRLMESRPMLTRIPDQGLIARKGPEPCVRTAETWPCGVPDHVHATRDAAGRYAMVYVPGGGRTVTVDARRLSGKSLVAWWYSPADGSARRIGTFPRKRAMAFTTPPGDDWVLVLDDAAKGYASPGRPPRPSGAGGGRSPAGSR
jgi:hypothetical protein